MEFWLILSIPVIGLILFYGIPWFLKKSRQRTAIAAIKNGRGVLSTWRYTPEEWRFATEEFFRIRTKSGDSGQVSFTPQYIYISNGKKDIFWELADENKHTKHLTEVYLFKTSPRK